MPPDNRRKVPNIRLVDGEKIDNLPDDTQGNITQVQSNLTSHEANTSNPHSVTKAQVGLDFVTNTGSPSEALFGDGVYRVPLGEGDVVGTSTSTDQNIAVFDGATGKLIEDGGIAKDTLALICNDQHSITNYTFTGSERRNGGYLCTTPSTNTTVNIDADLFDTGTEFLFCKGTNNAFTVTLDAGSGNNINGSQTLVLTLYNEFVTLIKDGANTWKAIQTIPKSSIALDSAVVHLTGDQTIGGIKTFSSPIIANTIKFNAPEGFLINGQIVTSESSGNLTVAIKTLAGTDPSITDPVYCRIGGVVRSITSACTITITNNDFYHFNAGSSELATKEIDYFVYLSEFGGPAITRIPYATSFADGDVGEKQTANTGGFSPTNKLVNIGRFNAIKASGTTGVWSLPATSVIINRPIYETRWLDCSSILSGLTGSAGSYAESGASAKYKISENTINFMFGKKVTNIGSWSGDSLLKTPFGGSNSSALILGSGGIMNGNNGTFKTIITPYGNSCEYLNFANNLGVNWGQYSVITVNDFIMGNVTYEI